MRYKVEFDNNIPVRAILADPGMHSEFTETDNINPSITSLFIDAGSADSAILMALRVIKNIWGDVQEPASFVSRIGAPPNINTVYPVLLPDWHSFALTAIVIRIVAVEERNISHIPFNIVASDMSYGGEITGKDLKDHRVFEVKMNNGEHFLVEANYDNRAITYKWISYTKDKFNKIVPLIGRVIEKYFSSNK